MFTDPTLFTLSLVISAIGAVVSFTFWHSHPLVEPFLARAGFAMGGIEQGTMNTSGRTAITFMSTG